MEEGGSAVSVAGRAKTTDRFWTSMGRLLSKDLTAGKSSLLWPARVSLRPPNRPLGASEMAVCYCRGCLRIEGD